MKVDGTDKMKTEECGHTERQLREIRFYEDYANQALTTEICFDPIAGSERRPWNSYWRTYELAKERYESGARVLLDFCCGSGATSLVFAKIGYDVHGFDITPANIEIARKLSEKHGLTAKTHFSVQPAEKTSFASGSFDVIAGIDVLHHIEIEPAMRECRRVLKDGGIAIFREPVETPAFDALRNSSPVKKLFPKGRSLERHITEDEKKLNAGDMAVIRRHFPSMKLERFTFLSRLDPFVRRNGSKGPSLLERVDHALFRKMPSLGRMGGGVVIKLKKGRNG